MELPQLDFDLQNMLDFDPHNGSVFNFSIKDVYDIINKGNRSNRLLDAHFLNVLIVIYIFLIVTGLFSNTMVWLVVVLRAQMRTPRNFYVVNLTVSDITLCIISMPFTLVSVIGDGMATLVALEGSDQLTSSNVSVEGVAVTIGESTLPFGEPDLGFAEDCTRVTDEGMSEEGVNAEREECTLPSVVANLEDIASITTGKVPIEEVNDMSENIISPCITDTVMEDLEPEPRMIPEPVAGPSRVPRTRAQVRALEVDSDLSETSDSEAESVPGVGDPTKGGAAFIEFECERPKRRVKKARQEFRCFVREGEAGTPGKFISEHYRYEDVVELKRVVRINEINLAEIQIWAFVAIEPREVDVRDLPEDYQQALRKMFTGKLGKKGRIIPVLETAKTEPGNMEKTGDIVSSIVAGPKLIRNMVSAQPKFEGTVTQYCFPFAVNLRNFTNEGLSVILANFRAGHFTMDKTPADFYCQGGKDSKYCFVHHYPSWAGMIRGAYSSHIFDENQHPEQKVALSADDIGSQSVLYGTGLGAHVESILMDFADKIVSGSELRLGFKNSTFKPQNETFDDYLMTRRQEENSMKVGMNEPREAFSALMAKTQIAILEEELPAIEPVPARTGYAPESLQPTNICRWCPEPKEGEKRPVALHADTENAKRKHMERLHPEYQIQCEKCNIVHLLFDRWYTTEDGKLQAHLTSPAHTGKGAECLRCGNRVVDMERHTGQKPSKLIKRKGRGGKPRPCQCTKPLQPKFQHLDNIFVPPVVAIAD